MSHETVRPLEELARGYRLLAALGWGDMGDGHISLRDAGRSDCFWMLGADVPFCAATVADLVLVDGDGVVVDGTGHTNMPGYYIHHPILLARPDITSAVHTHTQWGTPFSAEARLFQPITQESCVFFEDHALFDDEEVQVQSVAAGARIAQSLGRNRGLILRNHGLLTVGDGVAEAVAWFVMMERVAEAHMKATRAKPISASAARFAKSDLATPRQSRGAFDALVAHHLNSGLDGAMGDTP